jgi:hypothetical protein
VGSVTTLLLAETKESDGYLTKTAKNIRREGVWDKIKREENKKILTPEST